MPKSSRRFWIFGLVAGVLALCATRATSRYEGDTTGEPGRSIVLCDAKRAYEAAAALAEFADARYKQLAEPQWDTLYFKSANDPRRNPAQYLRDLKSEITKARQKVAKNGDGNPQQAEKNYQAARQQFDDVEVKYIAKLVQTSRLQREIQALMQEIQSLNAKLASTRKAVSLPDQKERTAKIKACETTISTAQTKLQSLLFSEKEEFDAGTARERIADPNFKKFSNADIRNLKRLWDETPPATPEFQALDGRIEKAIEEARQDAKKTLAEYSAASRTLSQLQSEDDENHDGGSELEKQKAAKQQELEAKTMQKARLGLQKPMAEDMNAALQKLSAANTKRSMAQQNAAAAQRAFDLENNLKTVEPWIAARLVRNGTQARMEKARQEYSQAIAIKDKRLGEAQARFNTLQVWITNQRAGLKGSEQDAAYWQTVSGIKKRAVSEYADMEADLSSMDCFPDVASLLSEIRARRKNAEAIRIGKVAAKTPPATPKTAASRSSLAGWWVWLRGSDRVPMILEAHGNSVFRGVYFPGITTRNIVSGKGPTVAIGFQALGDNKFKYRYKYPGSGDKGGRGGGVMTLSGNRMSGAWADDAGGAKGNWTLERATAAERAKLRKHFGRG